MSAVEGYGYGSGFALIVVLFILLIIVGSSFVGGVSDYGYTAPYGAYGYGY